MTMTSRVGIITSLVGSLRGGRYTYPTLLVMVMGGGLTPAWLFLLNSIFAI